MQLKGLHFAEIQEAVTDEIRKGEEEEFLAAFQNCVTAQNPVYMPMEPTLSKKSVCLRNASSI